MAECIGAILLAGAFVFFAGLAFGAACIKAGTRCEHPGEREKSLEDEAEQLDNYGKK